MTQLGFPAPRDKFSLGAPTQPVREQSCFLAFAVENLSIGLSKSWYDLNVSHI